MNKPGRKRRDGKSGIEIAEEAVHLLRRAPARALACYYLGSAPFILGLLYFWADMSKSAFAYDRLHGGVILLTALFIWMKTWQAKYAGLLWDEISGGQVRAGGLRRWLRMAVTQSIFQPSGLFLLPLALLVTAPFGWTYAFYQNITVLDDGDGMGVRDLARKAAELARPWQRQNHLLIWALSPFLTVAAAGMFLLIMPVVAAVTPDWTGVFMGLYSALFVLALMPLSPFGIVIAANIASALVFIPQLLKMLLGVNTVFLRSPETMFSTTFFAIVIGLTYLCMDPLMKAAYVLRCFYARSIRSGEDLKIELKRLVVMIMCALLLGGLLPDTSMASPGAASTLAEPAQSVSPPELDRALDRELQSRRYAWRMPRQEPGTADKKEGYVASFMRGVAETLVELVKTVRDWYRKFRDWVGSFMPDRAPGERRKFSDISGPLRLALYILLAALVSIAGVMLFRIWRRRGAQSQEVVAEAADAVPDIEDENTTADGLPEEGWLEMAQDLAEKGELRLAVRAIFLATLSHLSERELVSIARFKSNLDYLRELDLRAHARPEILDTFSGSITIYESVWYGVHEATRELFDRISERQERLRPSGNEL